MTKRILYSIISGLLLALSMPPFDAGFLAWAAFVPLMAALDGVDVKKGAVLGYAAGFAFFLFTVYWVIHSMYFYGGVPVFISVPVMLLMVAYLSLYVAGFGFFLAMTQGGNGIARLLMAPAAWVALEYLRAHLFTGFPWASLGYSQAAYLPVIQIADITGIWGVSYVIVAANMVVYGALKSILKKDGDAPVKEAAIALLLVASVFAYGLVRIAQVDRDSAGWEYIRASVAQGNVDQSLKWDEKFRDKTVSIYKELSRKAASEGARLVVWPETAVPFFLSDRSDDPKNAAVREITKEAGIYVLTGSPSYNYNLPARKVDYFNSAYVFSPAGDVLGRYDKVHLVPFGEYVPMKRFLPFITKLTAGVGDFVPGPGPLPITFDGNGAGVIICFEAIFPEISRREVANGATILVNLTNDAWFGRTSAPYQHFGMSVVRAVENRVYLLRAANTGISAIVDPVGRVRKKSGLFEEAVLTDDVGVRAGKLSFYTVYGDVFAYGCLFLSGLFLFSRIGARR